LQRSGRFVLPLAPLVKNPASGGAATSCRMLLASLGPVKLGYAASMLGRTVLPTVTILGFPFLLYSLLSYT